MTESRSSGDMSQQDGPDLPTMASKLGVLREPSREIPIIDRPDVLVVGGGSAGFAAAIAASRAGAHTVLVERQGYLGGLATGGLIILLLTLDDGAGVQVVAGICQELVDRLDQRGAAVFPKASEWGSSEEALLEEYRRWGLVWGRGPHRVRYSVAYEPNAFKLVADDMVESSGAKLRLHTWVTDVVVRDGFITHVICQSKSGRQAIQPKVVIDATGDGDLFAFAGLPYELARVHAWRWYRMANVQDLGVAAGVESEHLYPSMGGGFFNTIGEGRTLMPWGIADHVDRRIDPTSTEDLTYAEVESRKMVMAQAEELRGTLPGFEKAYLADMSDQLGITESRRLIGSYVLRREDENRSFEDAIAITGNWTKYGVRYQIPYRSLMSEGVRNLLVAGRCISVSKRVHHSTKEIPPCMATGQASGVAAAMAANRDAEVDAVNVRSLRSRLRGAGAIVDA